MLLLFNHLKKDESFFYIFLNIYIINHIILIQLSKLQLLVLLETKKKKTKKKLEPDHKIQNFHFTLIFTKIVLSHYI